MRYTIHFRRPSPHGEQCDPTTAFPSKRDAIKEANHLARTYHNHPDFVGGTFEVEDRHSGDIIHTTTKIKD